MCKYKTRDDWVLLDNIMDAPLGEKILALTLGGVLVITTLSEITRKFYTQWSPLPKKQKKLDITEQEKLDITEQEKL